MVQINEYLQERLNAKIDLTKQDQQEDGTKELGKKSKDKKDKQSQGDKIVLTQMEQIEKNLTEKFVASQQDFDTRMVNVFKANEKQQADIDSRMQMNEVTHKQWQKEQEFEGNIIIQELMRAN